jgi:hypothetical protein
MVDDPVGADRVPDRDGDTEEPLPGDEPVSGKPVDPVLIPDSHEFGYPVQRRPSLEEP